MSRFAPFPMPGDQILGGTVIASTYFNEDDYEAPLVLVMLLMPQAPYYLVGNVWLREIGHEWETEPWEHTNIVTAVKGDEHPFRDGKRIPEQFGYEQLGGDY